MRLIKTIFLVLLLAGLPAMNLCAQKASAEAQPVLTPGAVREAAKTAEESHGLPPAAVHVLEIGPLVVTNSMILVWIVAAGLIVLAQMATRNMQMVPSGLQNFWEWLVESLYTFLEEVLGSKLVKKSFWFFATIFLLILCTNWFGLIPGVGTIGHKITYADGVQEFRPWLRGGNADLNMTSAMALIFFFLWIVWALQINGPVGVLKHIFGGGAGGTGFMKYFMIAIFFFVGLIEVISIAFRPVSLSFRLFGNIFAGENILEAMMHLVPWLSWLVPLPFYFLELLVGIVQALVFTLLTAVFTALMCTHEEHDNGHNDHAKVAH
jgi:F-type H+-transporting ATPase subunit a